MNDVDRQLSYKLEDYISRGYEWIEKIEEEYHNSSSEELGSILDKFYRIITEWENQVKDGLPNTARKLKFSTAKSTDPTYESGKNRDIQNLVKSIRARIGVLESYQRELKQPYINIGTQARVNINSIDRSTNIIADQYSQTVNQLEAEFEQNYQGVDKKEILNLIKELKDKPERKRGTEIIGQILSKGADLAQVASLAAQLLSIIAK